MALVDELISETETLLQSLRAVKHDIESPSRQRATPSSLHSRSVSAASRPLEIDNALRDCRNVLSSIISNARTLLEQLPPDGSAAGWADTQQQATASTHASMDAPEQPRVNATDLPAAYAPTIPLLLNPAPSSREQSPTPSVSSSANAELVASLLRDFINGDEEADCQQNNTPEGGQSGSHNEEQHGTGVDAEPEGTQRAGAEGVSDRYGRGVHIVDFGVEQMGAALVAQLEMLAAVTPSHCYDKIRVIDFDSPNFSQAQTPASGYMRCSIYSKDGFKVTALTTNVDFTFPSADTLSQEHSRLSLEAIRSVFQDVFDKPPNEALPYFVGPIPMPPDYVPFVDAGPKLRRRNNGNIPGVNTPFWYISQCDRTPATLHIEDGNLDSVNLLLAGAPKLWLFIPNCKKTNIERRMKELYGPGRVPCSQGIRHYNAIFSPVLLEKWGIAYHLDCSLPGEMIVTRQNTYHQVLNMGPNVAESVNIEFSDTPDMPVGYVWCKRGSGPSACGPHVITASDFSSSPVETRSNMKRTRIQAITPASKTKKAKGMKPSSILSNQKGLTHGRFTNAQIYDIFATKLGYQADTTIELLTCLFFAVASPEAINQ
ncbi:JmjC domain-containing histone demethylation protein [Paraphaeosphaeria minitans]|uniref:JmjC domain-containing histone demethylation protein n=1 Tax=Paraphaeosphaeria minitans TaxID=565426 RepID=A0A9P6G3M9_9PLEO|nr:JmjC domain-containing histone demethylation protein [Paraphaeosphaeria minitans]